MASRVPSLVTIFRQVRDPRQRRGRRHPLAAILSLVCLGTMCGLQGMLAISEWGRLLPSELLRALGFGHRPPCATTLSSTLARVNHAEIERYFGFWADMVLSALLGEDSEPETASSLEGVSIDGKTLRGSKKQGADSAHLLTALDQRYGIPLRQRAVSDKTNEIGEMSAFLEGLALEGRLATMDALLTQRDVAEQIVEQKGDYLMVVKENQPTLHDDLQTFFEHTDGSPPSSDLSVEHAETVDKAHGRLETRRITTTTALNDYVNWPHVGQTFRMERHATLLRSGKPREETVYGVTSLTPQDATPRQLMESVRRHWHIENRLFYVRDVSLGEDLSQVRKGALPHVMAAIRNVVIGCFRWHGFRSIPTAIRFCQVRIHDAMRFLGIEGEMLRTG